MSGSIRGVDVAVIGGGIIGTAAALELARAGASVTLFESVAIGAGASGRNSGSVQHPFDDVLAPLHVRTLERYRVLSDEAGEGFGFPEEPAGLLLLGLASRMAALEMEAAATRRSAPFLEPTLVEGVELHTIEPALAPDLAGVRLETAYPVPPAAAVTAYALLAERAGARILVGQAATIALDDGRVVGVRTDDGTLHPAAAVLLAAGPAAADLADPGERWRPIVRTWGVTVAVRLPRPPRHVLEQAGVASINRPEGIVEGPDAPPDPAGAKAPVEPMAHFPSTFSLVTARGLSVVGSTFLPLEPDVGSVGPLLLHRGDRFVPGLHGIGVDELRACARPQSLDGRPLVGRVPGHDDLYICAGHGPWGISTGPETAALVADLILGRSPDIPVELDPARFAMERAGTPH
jgi:glycine/D-amino acid oxidase-like deaminating enzyme